MPWAFSLQVKQLGYETNHSPQSNAKIKNGGAILHCPICLYGMALHKLCTGTILDRHVETYLHIHCICLYVWYIYILYICEERNYLVEFEVYLIHSCLCPHTVIHYQPHTSISSFPFVYIFIKCDFIFYVLMVFSLSI
jgi:hypothetical protein